MNDVVIKPIAQNKRHLLWVSVALAVIVVDQISKYFISHFLFYQQQLTVLPFFKLVLWHNQGAAFSFLQQSGVVALWLFAIVALVVSAVIVFYLIRLPANKLWLTIALALILGGALGNLIDRMVHGYVIDFLFFQYKGFSWPAFNLADSAVVVGAGMIIIELLFWHKADASVNE